MNPDRAAAVGRLAGLIVARQQNYPVRVAIDGVDGAGKTTLADDLARAVRTRGRPCLRASIDDFHRPATDRHRRGRHDPEGFYRDAYDYATLRSALLEPLGPRGDRRYRTATFDLGRDAPVDQPPKQAPRNAVLLVDGSFLQRRELEGAWDFRVWVETGEETARARAVARDRGFFGPEVDRRYRERYVPAQRLYIEEIDPAHKADVRFVNNDPDHPVLVLRES